MRDDIIAAHYTAHSSTTNRNSSCSVLGIAGCKGWRERGGGEKEREREEGEREEEREEERGGEEKEEREERGGGERTMELLLSQEGSTDDKLMSLLHILTKQLVANEPMLGIYNMNFTYQIYQPDNLNSFFYPCKLYY